MSSEEMREGFLCPYCYTDFKTYVRLTAHFQLTHSDKEILKSVKDIYEKTKNKILLRESSNAKSETEEAPVVKGTLGYLPSAVDYDLCASRSHTEFYKTVRAFRTECFTAQTNNLLIRLDKLLFNLPTDPVKRKAHEQDIVPWLDDKDVKLCPGCAKPFGILRRKHHCRLCGGVMCNDCTSHLPLDAARKMTSTLIGSSSSSNNTPVKKLLRSPSSSSVQSVLSLELSTDSFFRLCEHCFKLLEVREKLKEVRNQKPIICQFYEKMMASIVEADSLLTTYNEMYQSICAGNSQYNLPDAEMVRVKILKLAESIDFMSKKINVLGQNTDNPPQGSQLLLQKNIRNAAANYLKDNVITLPSLPSEAQIKEVQEQRRLQLERKIKEEKESTRLTDQQKSLQVSSSDNNLGSPSHPKDAEMILEEYWTPEFTQPMVNDNPLIEQINIIQGYIKQAKLANKLDELAIFEANLAELREEYYEQLN